MGGLIVKSHVPDNWVHEVFATASNVASVATVAPEEFTILTTAVLAAVLDPDPLRNTVHA
jgi:hypothetical protein